MYSETISIVLNLNSSQSMYLMRTAGLHLRLRITVDCSVNLHGVNITSVWNDSSSSWKGIQLIEGYSNLKIYNVLMWMKNSPLVYMLYAIVSKEFNVSPFNFFSVRVLSVLRGRSVFFIPATRANDLRLRRIFIPDCIHYFLSHLISWERASISLFNVECQTRKLLVPSL